MIVNYVTRLYSHHVTCILYLLMCISNAACLEARVKLDVNGEGFHRTLVYQIGIRHFTVKNCYVAVYLELPTGLYVNVDEIAELRRLGSTLACSIGETDVELFMEKAKAQNVTICSALKNKNLTFQLPIHQRYQYATKDGAYRNITLEKPKLFLGCKERIKDYRVSKIDLCSPCDDAANKWREIPYIMEENTDYVWNLPIGNSSILGIVTYVTLTVTVLSAIFILWAIKKSMKQVHPKKD